MKYRVIKIFSISALVAASLVVVQTQNSNIALSARATASSDNANRGQNVAKAIDGVVGGYPANITAEWVAPGQLGGAWIRLTWSGTVTASQVVLHDRVNTIDQITAGVLRFSDGSTVPVGALANDGTGTAVNFSARQISWVQFDITGARGENTGLAEFEVFGAGGGTTTPPPTTPPPTTPPPTTPPPTTVSCMPGTQSVTTGQAANFSAAGGSGSYAWSAPGGSPANGSASSFSTTYASAGTRNVTVSRGGVNATCQAVVTAPPTTPPPTTPAPPTGALFSSGWDSAALGCGSQLLDGVWFDYGGASACTANPQEAQVVGNVSHDGPHSLMVTQRPGEFNGTDFRIVKPLPSPADATFVWWVRYDNNYRWASADHKILITGASQAVYVNYRGGVDPLHARVVLGITAADAVFAANDFSQQVTVGKWYRLRVYIRAGGQGTVRGWLMEDGQPEQELNFVHDAGNNVPLSSINTGPLDSFKLDTTYNLGSYITEPMRMWYDSVAVYRGLVAP